MNVGSKKADFDVIIVGAGIAGSSLGNALARRGLKVMLLEKATAYHDRVRGEAILPWGVVEAQRLGVDRALLESCGHLLNKFEFSFGGDHQVCRNLPETTPHQNSCISFRHEEMQQTLAEVAQNAGCHTLRGTQALGYQHKDEVTTVQYRSGDTFKEVTTRLIVAADGRLSLFRSMGGFRVKQDPTHILSSGVLLENVDLPSDAISFKFNLLLGEMSLAVPLGNRIARLYLFHQSRRGNRYSGHGDWNRFREGCLKAGFHMKDFQDASPIGPLATFDGAAKWVEHPAQERIVLIGDAAGSSDPTWGAGLSEALRDARLLSEVLLETDDWNTAIDKYALSRNAGYQQVRTVNNWYAEILMNHRPEGLARLNSLIPHIVKDQTRMPDVFALGPETPIDETARSRFFCEDVQVVEAS